MLTNKLGKGEKCPYSELFWSVFSRIWTVIQRDTEYLSRIQSKCGKIRTRITPNTDAFYALEEMNIEFFNACKDLR